MFTIDNAEQSQKKFTLGKGEANILLLFPSHDCSHNRNRASILSQVCDPPWDHLLSFVSLPEERLSAAFCSCPPTHYLSGSLFTLLALPSLLYLNPCTKFSLLFDLREIPFVLLSSLPSDFPSSHFLFFFIELSYTYELVWHILWI